MNMNIEHIEVLNAYDITRYDTFKIGNLRDSIESCVFSQWTKYVGFEHVHHQRSQQYVLITL